MEKETKLNTEVFPDRLKAICIEKGIKNANQLSSYLEANTDLAFRYDTVRKWWRGESIPDLENFVPLCNALEVSPGYLLGEISRPNYEEHTLSDLSGLSSEACKILSDKESGFINLLRAESTANDLFLPLLYSEGDFRKVLSILIEMPDFVEVLRKIYEIRKNNLEYAQRLEMHGKSDNDTSDFYVSMIKPEYDTVVSAWKYDLEKSFIHIIEKITAFRWSDKKSK